MKKKLSNIYVLLLVILCLIGAIFGVNFGIPSLEEATTKKEISDKAYTNAEIFTNKVNINASGGDLRYDAAKKRRDKPLTDPFLVNDILKDRLPIIIKTGEQVSYADKSVSSIELNGIFIAEEKTLALLRLGDKSGSFAPGESIGSWTLVKVTAEYVVLQGPTGEMILRLQRGNVL